LLLLALDPDLDSYYLQSIVVTRMPAQCAAAAFSPGVSQPAYLV
jgi:hypothetical protein